jgi:hypothetical protein
MISECDAVKFGASAADAAGISAFLAAVLRGISDSVLMLNILACEQT